MPPARRVGQKAGACQIHPRFIVNRVARPFYAEAQRVYQDGAASPATIDAVMRDCGGFRMGPFELMDLIGHDVNYAVTNSVFDAYFKDERFLPSLVQKDLVDAGWLAARPGAGFMTMPTGRSSRSRTPPPLARPRSRCRCMGWSP